MRCANMESKPFSYIEISVTLLARPVPCASLDFSTGMRGGFGPALEYGRLALAMARNRGDTTGEANALHTLAEIRRRGSKRVGKGLRTQCRNGKPRVDRSAALRRMGVEPRGAGGKKCTARSSRPLRAKLGPRLA